MQAAGRSPRVAIVHDYLTQRGGAERVVLSLLRMFPDADLYTSVYDRDGTYPEFQDLRIRTTVLQRLPHRGLMFRALLPLYAHAFSRMRLSGYDLVISSSSGFAHRVKVTDGLHVCYCYTPPRFLHRTDDYLAGGALGTKWVLPVIRPLVRRLRLSDVQAARRPDRYVTVSREIADRVADTYGRDADIINPPVDVRRILEHDGSVEGGAPYYLMVSRLLPYKRVDAAVRAARQRGVRLVVVGSGPSETQLRRIASPEVEFRCDIDEVELNRLLHGCTALVQPGLEDFGLVPLEANAAGRPVIAYRSGGGGESVVDGVTGVHIDEQTPQAIADAMDRIESTTWDADKLRRHATSFGEDRFHGELQELLATLGLPVMAGAAVAVAR